MLKDLRSFLRVIEGHGDLVHIAEPVSPEFGVAAGMRKTSDIHGPALWFDNVVGARMPVVGALYAHRRRAIWGFETSPAEFFDKFLRGFNHPIAPRLVKAGPCKEVVHLGDKADLGLLPVCTHNRKDAGPFITMGLAIARHPTYGTNVSIHRMQVFDGKTTGMLARAPQQLGIYQDDAAKRGEPLEVAVTIGNDPYTTLCSQQRGSIYLDEFAIAGGWLGEPVDLVRCETIDVAVPATSEIVLEGVMLPGDVRLEGPFGEYPGYYMSTGERPVFRIQAITHRKNPIYLAGLTGTPTTDNHVMTQVTFEAMLYGRLREICPTVHDVCITDGGAGLHVVISMTPAFPTQPREIILAAFTAERVRPKLVIIVDADIDPRNPQQVEWAVATRVQANRDVLIIERAVGQTLDPSVPVRTNSAVMGIDATRPVGEPFPEVADVPGAESFVIPGWTDATGRPVSGPGPMLTAASNS